MNPTIAALHALQAHDRRMVALEKRLSMIPKRIEEMDEDLGSLGAMVAQERAKLEDTIRFRDEQIRRLEDEEEQIRQSKLRLGAVQTTRELHAAQREIDTTRRLANTRATEIDNINEAIEQANARVEKMQSSLDALSAEFDGERTRLANDRKKLEAALGKDGGTRSKLTAAVEKVLLRRYERMRKRLGGVAFVPVRERRCGGCKMTVPHAKYVELRNGSEILDCESCGRLLYWQGHFPEEAAKAEAKLRKAQQARDEAALSESA